MNAALSRASLADDLVNHRMVVGRLWSVARSVRPCFRRGSMLVGPI